MVERRHPRSAARHPGRCDQEREGIDSAGHGHENSSGLALERRRNRSLDDSSVQGVVVHATGVHT
jgi:hypothetical protein